jgi:hypothetical protein
LLELGAQACLSKPLDLERLEEELNKVLVTEK